jgi:uncharacterized protein (DUF433 family)
MAHGEPVIGTLPPGTCERSGRSNNEERAAPLRRSNGSDFAYLHRRIPHDQEDLRYRSTSCYLNIVAKNAIYGGRDPRDVPMYRLVEAAGLLRVPASTLRSWTKGQDYKVQGERRRFEPPIPLDEGQEFLTFYNLVEAFVLASMRRNHNVELPVVRAAVNFVRTKMGVKRPLLTKDFYTDGVSLLVDEWGRLVDASNEGQAVMREVVATSLKRIDRDRAGLAARLYPWRKSPTEDRLIELDPALSLGRAVLAGTGISIDVLRARRRAGDTVERLAKDYAVDKSKVRAVVEWDEQLAA